MEAVSRGDIEIGPYAKSHVVHGTRRNPASYDLTLGSEVAVYSNWVERKRFPKAVGEDGSSLLPRLSPVPIDARKKPKVERFKMGPGGWVIKPGIGYLMHTEERIKTEQYVPVLDGKSSIGRLFIAIHVTAGYGDPGFDGQYTLEVIATGGPVVVYPGMRFCQIRFHTAVGEHLSYQKTGHYRRRLASGPVPSMAWKQFEENPDAQVVSGRGRARGR